MMKTEVLWAAIATIAAIVSALLAFWSTMIAKRALRLSERDTADRARQFSLYLIDGFRYKINAAKEWKSILAFSLSVTNSATQPNSIVRIELHVECLREDGQNVVYTLSHNPKLSESIVGLDLTPFECPVPFGPKEGRSGWVLFSESPVVPPRIRRDRYVIVLTDATGSDVRTTCLIVGELKHNEDQTDKS